MEKNARKLIIKKLFRNVLQTPVMEMNIFQKYISPKYVHYEDGRTYHYLDFIEYIKKQKETLTYLDIEFIALFEDNENVFSHHIITIRKTDNSILKIKVLAHFVFEKELLIKCDKLSCII